MVGLAHSTYHYRLNAMRRPDRDALSSAIASNLAKGYPLDAAVERAKAYISGCLSAMLDLGKGSGPMDHMFALRGEFVEH